MARETRSPTRYRLEGPGYKGSDQYLTAEGFPLGTTCYYWHIDGHGWREVVAASTLAGAWQAATAWIAAHPCDRCQGTLAPFACESACATRRGAPCGILTGRGQEGHEGNRD